MTSHLPAAVRLDGLAKRFGGPGAVAALVKDTPARQLADASAGCRSWLLG
jgi:hypothetical protein